MNDSFKSIRGGICGICKIACAKNNETEIGKCKIECFKNTTNSERTISKQLQERIISGSRNCRFYKERFELLAEQMVNVINNLKSVEDTTI